MDSLESRNRLHLRWIAVASLTGALLLAAPIIAHAGKAYSSTIWANGYSTRDDGSRFGWSVFDPSDGSSTCDTDGDDWRDIQRSLRDEDATVFWFKLDGRRYIVRDRDLVARAEEIVEPMRELGHRQGELGAKQGALGARQGALGAKQGSLGARHAAIAARVARMATLADEDRDGASWRERREIEEAMREISEQQSMLGREQSSLGRVQSELGRQQSELGREQSRLSARANEDLRRLADEAIRAGKAEPLGRWSSL